MRDAHEGTGPVLDGHRETTQSVAVQEIGRFVEDEDLRFRPERGGEDDLDLLTARETLDLVVLCDVAVEAEVGEGLPDELEGELAGAGAFSGCLKVVKLLDELGEAQLDQTFPRDPGVVAVLESAPLDFVRVRLLELLSPDDLLDEPLLSRLCFDRGVEQSLVLVAEDTGRLLGNLTVVTVLVSPLDVLAGRLLQVLTVMTKEKSRKKGGVSGMVRRDAKRRVARQSSLTCSKCAKACCAT